MNDANTNFSMISQKLILFFYYNACHNTSNMISIFPNEILLSARSEPRYIFQPSLTQLLIFKDYKLIPNSLKYCKA